MSKTRRVNLMIEPDLDDMFRNKVVERYGMKKGNLSKAFEEAMKMWIAK